MATQIVMDRTGDTRHNFDAKNADALLKAEERFSELTGAGFTAAVRTASGEAVVKRTFDPMYGPAVRCKNVWSGRALQEDFVELAAAVLHQCIRPQIGACCAPGHHGYQRACVLISGQTSIGPFGSPVFARARKTDPPFCLILSQTSAGNC